MRIALLLATVCSLLVGSQNPAPRPAAGGNVEATLKQLGITLPTPAKPMANYVPAVRTGNLVFLAGAGPKQQDGSYVTGKLGDQLSVEQGYDAARLTAITQLAALKAEIGNLDKVKRIVKVVGMVNADAKFSEHPQVVNGFSDLMVSVFGERGKHARSAIGVASLPLGIAVEIEMVVEVEGS